MAQSSNDRPTCPYCDGSGEGQMDGTTCRPCRGTGEVIDHEAEVEARAIRADYLRDRTRDDRATGFEADRAADREQDDSGWMW